ncbi:MAG TPA: hypothetical protein VE979_15805 [Streptosporangiaceae bacterium]|nr:hypothetical protein [Streptosporangiaceae bacterium]
MSRMVSRGRIAPAAAILLGLVVLGMLVLTVVLDSLTHYPGTGGPLVDSLTVAAAGIPAASVATLLAARRPGNPIGWLLFGILFAGYSPSNQYDILAYRTHPGTLPLGWVSVVFEELWPLFLVFVAILLWVFPDGKLPAGRWRRPSVVLLVSGLLLGVVASTSGVIVVARGDVRIRATGDLANPPGGGFEVLDIAVIALSLVAWLAWILIQIPTYRRADGERRQQLKWLYSGATVTLVAFVFGVFVVPVAAGHAPGYPSNPVISALVVLAFGAMPASLGVAVLKYRLYELDRIISRVVSYALITTLLVGFYTGLVLLTTHVLPYKSAVAVAACTLITAALFNPLRKRVQRLVDRRFNRSRYNAEAVVAAFTARMRQTVDFDAVRDDLVGVVHEAFQPTQVSMWLVEARSGHDTGSVHG